MRCISYCLSETIKLNQLADIIRRQSPLTIQKHWQVLELSDSNRKTNCYIFANGTLVSWNLIAADLKPYIKWIKQACTGLLKNPIFDEFHYEYGDTTTIAPHETFHIDCLVLENDDSELQLSLSYGFSQSIKLKYYETKIEHLISSSTPITKELSLRGAFRLPYRRTQRIIGDVMQAKGELNLMGDFLYQPKFFWQHPNLEQYFKMLERYLDIQKRTEMLNQQLDTLHEIFIMCSSYLESRNSHRLEIVIVVLITIEIISSLLNLHLHF